MPLGARYSSKPPPMNFGRSGAFGSEPQKKREPNHLADFLRFAGGVAVPLSTVAGGLAGTFAAPGLGTAAGAGLGAAAGTAGAGFSNYLADSLEAGDVKEEEERMNREIERRARAQAALSIL